MRVWQLLVDEGQADFCLQGVWYLLVNEARQLSVDKGLTALSSGARVLESHELQGAVAQAKLRWPLRVCAPHVCSAHSNKRKYC